MAPDRGGPRGLRELRYRIGGFPVSVIGSGVDLMPEDDPEYLPFLDAEPPPGPAAVRIAVAAGRPEPVPREGDVLEAGESWTLRSRGGVRVVAPWVERPGEPPAWEAELAPGDRDVRITCGEGLFVPCASGRCAWSPFHYPLDQVVYMLALAGEAAIVHAAGIDLGGVGILLAGASGAGKTTIARLCARRGIPVLSDDRVFVRRNAGGARLFGSPWPGEGRFALNRGVPLAAILLLGRGGTSEVRPVEPRELSRAILGVSSVPVFDAGAAAKALALLEELVAVVPGRAFPFRPDESAVRALERAFA